MNDLSGKASAEVIAATTVSRRAKVLGDALVASLVLLTAILAVATLLDDHASAATETKPAPIAMSAAHASCYRLFGNSTANGTVIAPQTVGVAHRTLPFGTRVWIKSNGRSVVARVIDRGPFVAGRVFDLTHGTVRRLGFSSCESFGHRDVKYAVLRRR